jgi:cytochrome c oxidase cbb3-type subunit 3
MASRDVGVEGMNEKRCRFYFDVRCLMFWAAVTSGLFGWVAVASPQVHRRPANVLRPEGQSSTEGRRTFEGKCAPCHGLDGRGGERAPDIATKQRVQRQSDAQIFRTIHNGVPGTGMPSFGTLDSARIGALVNYLRLLQGQRDVTSVSGDPRSGKGLFFGRARCSECHSLQGEGGFVAADLSIFGRMHSIEETREAITNPGKAADFPKGTVIVTTRDGQKYLGVVRNEDNFSLQLQTIDGTFHLLMKSDLGNISRQPESLMPANYGSTLSPKELDDLVGFLMITARSGKSDAAPSKKASRVQNE